MSTVRHTVAQALVRFLAAQHVERDGVRRRFVHGVWAIFGHGNVAGLGQALEELGDELGLPTFRPQNEQAMVHAAAAYAKHRDRLATFACTASIGPGSTNMLTAAAGATINRLPVLLLPSDLFATRRPDPVLQQLEHPVEHDVTVNDAFRAVSRSFARVHRPEALMPALLEAMRVLTDPAETGAVTIALPEDVQAEAFDWPEAAFAPRTWRVRRPEPEREAVARAARALADAERPLIVAGGGVRYAGAGTALARFAAGLGIPVVETQAGKGALPWDHPMNAGPVGAAGGSAANELARDADVVLAIGTRMGDFVTGSLSVFGDARLRIVGLNVVPMDAHKLGALPLVADALRGIEALERAVGDLGAAGAGAGRRARIAALKDEWDATVTRLRTPDHARDGGALAQAEVLGIVNDAVGGAAVAICAAGSMPGDLLKLWRASDPRAYHVEYGYSCMGYEIPAGIGVAMAEPGRRVVVLIGDGSYLMMNSEIVTAVAEGLSFTVVLVDNRGFRSILGLQRSVGSPSFLNELRHRDRASGRLEGRYVDVDYVLHARAMGATAVLAPDPAALRRALDDAAAGGVHVIVVPVDPDRRVGAYGGWWDVPVAEVSGQPGVREARSRYEADLARARPLALEIGADPGGAGDGTTSDGGADGRGAAPERAGDGSASS